VIDPVTNGGDFTSNGFDDAVACCTVNNPAVALALRVDYMVEDEVPRVCLAAPAVHGPFCNLNFQI
jgi:hypothetical protein